ncbi:hypothetical protein [Agrobacterium tumefaciens]|jgi:hypothetical protein|uniref:hypothetical protein n=1 Tax=Agrobacterium tumefaciens TaxID=358 RepID=UPI000DD4B96D|nr:hypothetical protein [Agrobacterium tumefaciens]MDP9874060.1 hypothetical protein [Agrobacterium tumefaciens]MDP9978657.1 hypothetical protein [Agrobacterium tumefaciens]
MQLHLTDLDALTLTVRQPLSRSYIQEAIQAYRSGSYKAAIVAVYVAVTFDIISKIRELGEGGDAKALAFVATFDANVRENNTKKLLEIEGKLLDTAEAEFEFLDPITKRHFDRLKQDRNLCAHPAFTADGQLFMPEPELVRLYIVEAVRNLLSQRPIQGRAIINQFDQEFKSASFPTNAEEIVRFVRGRYLENSRIGVHTSLAAVFAKALLKTAPEGWSSKLHLLPLALQAVKDTDASVWSSTTLPLITRLIDEASDETLPNSFGILARFKDVRDTLSQQTWTRLHTFVENCQLDENDVRVFGAAVIPEFAAKAAARLAKADLSTQVAVFSRFPLPVYWPIALAKLRSAGSFRGAEALFSGCISPFVQTADPPKTVELFETVVANNQILYAAGIPSGLELFVSHAAQKHPLHFDHLEVFLSAITKHEVRGMYECVLGASGVVVPPPPPQNNELL